MKKFNFRLKGLLALRTSLEREVRNQLFEAQNLCRAKQDEILKTEDKIDSWSKYYDQIQEKRVQFTELALIDRHIQGLYRFREQLKIGLEILNRKRDDLLKHYADVKRELKILEHLRDRRLASYQEEYRRELQKEADEMATLRFSRAGLNEGVEA